MKDSLKMVMPNAARREEEVGGAGREMEGWEIAHWGHLMRIGLRVK